MTNKILFSLAFIATATALSLPLDQIRDLDQRYQLTSTSQKLVDNFGDGFEPLYGVRNFRMVLRGILYRGGANNAYNKYQKRENQNPLPTMGLQNLCSQDFKTAVYLYETNFSTAPQKVSCTNTRSEKSQLNYLQITGLDESNTNTILEMIYKAIKGQGPSPIYMHCWNGWHASGLVSTLALRQFCGLSASEGLQYWIKNTDGNSDGYTAIKARIQNFKPLSQFQISQAEQKEICL
jgi:hypothetical protein